MYTLLSMNPKVFDCFDVKDVEYGLQKTTM